MMIMIRVVVAIDGSVEMWIEKCEKIIVMQYLDVAT